MKNIILFTVLVLFGLNNAIKSQESLDKEISIMFVGNLSVPLGHFGENIGYGHEITRRFGFNYGEEVGLAKSGLGLGVEIMTNVLIKNVYWTVSSKLMMNSVDVTEIKDEFAEDLGDTVQIEFDNGSWINIPVFTGFTYYYDLLSDFKIYCTLQGGINITQQAQRKAIVKGTVVEETNFKFTPDFGFETGVGIELFGKYNIGIRYLNLNSPRYNGTRKMNENFFTGIPRRSMNVDGDERPVTMLIIFLGFKI